MGEGVSTITSGSRQRGSDNLSSQKPNVASFPDGTKAEWKVSRNRAEMETDKVNVYVNQEYDGKYKGKYRAEGWQKPPGGVYERQYVAGMGIIDPEPNYISRHYDTIDEAIKSGNEWAKYYHNKK